MGERTRIATGMPEEAMPEVGRRPPTATPGTWGDDDRARAEERLRRTAETFSALIEKMPFGVYVIDADFRIVEASALARHVFGIESLLGTDLGEALRTIWPEPFAGEAIARFRNTLATGEPFVSTDTVEHRADRDAVEAYDWRIERIRMPDDRFGVACYFYDLTERQRLEAALRETSEQLREADRQKDAFIATLAHELRNPLAPILNASQVLEAEAGGNGSVSRAAGLIVRQAGHMARLLDDLLDVSSIARGRIRLHRSLVDLVRIVETSVEDVRPAFDADSIGLSIHAPDRRVVVSADATRLSQMLANLLTNARKFTDADGSVDVAVTTDDESGTAIVRVTDSGIGMSRTQVDRIFQPIGERDLDRSRGGLGLGLAITKGLAELHGGRVTAASDGPGHGSTFSLELPLATGSEPPAEPVPEFVAAPLRILLIEDQSDVAEALQLLLEDLGHHVDVAATGAAGVEHVRHDAPDLVLCDIGLPDMDGYAVARDLRSDERPGGTYLVALTGYGQRHDRRMARDAGFDEHLTKPVAMDALEALAERVTRMREQR